MGDAVGVQACPTLAIIGDMDLTGGWRWGEALLAVAFALLSVWSLSRSYAKWQRGALGGLAFTTFAPVWFGLFVLFLWSAIVGDPGFGPFG